MPGLSVKDLCASMPCSLMHAIGEGCSLLCPQDLGSRALRKRTNAGVPPRRHMSPDKPALAEFYVTFLTHRARRQGGNWCLLTSFESFLTLVAQTD